MRLGTFLYVDSLNDIHALTGTMSRLKQEGFECCQVNWRVNSLMNADRARVLRRASEESGLAITGVSTFFDGVSRWNVLEGPLTVGLLPADQRSARLAHVLKTADFCMEAGVRTLFGHLGYLPTNPCDLNYVTLVSALKTLAPKLKSMGMRYLFETGQEPAVIFLRLLEDVGADNLFINFDPANVTMYGFGNAMDALELYGSRIRGVHVKDGLLPENGHSLGREVFLGEGRVNWPQILYRLIHEYRFDGDLIIERQIDEPQRSIDAARELLILRQWFEKATKE